jgi:hypothetical protein
MDLPARFYFDFKNARYVRAALSSAADLLTR